MFCNNGDITGTDGSSSVPWSDVWVDLDILYVCNENETVTYDIVLWKSIAYEERKQFDQYLFIFLSKLKHCVNFFDTRPLYERQFNINVAICPITNYMKPFRVYIWLFWFTG